MNKIIRKEIDFAGKKLVLETGELALRANMAVKATYGDSVLLVTVVSGEPTIDTDFLGLRVQYEEKLYASGSIKSSRFVKREGRATDDAIIARRTVDHAIRPLFPKDYMDEVQLVVMVLSLDEEADPEFLSMIASSACLQASDVPWYHHMITARIGLINGELVMCPTLKQLEEESDLDMMVSFSGEDQKFLAAEVEANILPEEKILEAINFARDGVKPLLKLIEDFVKEVNPENKKYEYKSKALSEETMNEIQALVGEKVEKIMRSKGKDDGKQDINDELWEVREEMFEKFEGTYKKVDMELAFENIKKEVVRKIVLDEGKRIDGRKTTEVRPISIKVGVLPRTHGSALFTRGETQSLTICTLGSPSDELLIQDMYGEKNKRYLHYYNFPPYSVGEVGRFGAPGAREIGHGMIAEKALRPVIPDQEEFPYTIMLVSEIISSNGSSSMAATCGSALALMDAGVPIKDVVSGIAMGLIVEDETFKKYKILTDLAGEEDAGGFMDLKIAGTKDGVTAIQCDIKAKGIPMELLSEIFDQSKEGRMHILGEMQKAISSPREEVSKYAPKMLTIMIDPSKIGVIIGTGGKTIKEIQEKTGTEISIEDTGKVVVSSPDKEKAEKALKIVEALTKDVKVGEVYDGTVKDLLDFGALVEVLPGKVGLLHVSEIADTYVKNVEDYLKIGDAVKVKVIETGENGKFSLSKRAVEDPNYVANERPARPRNGGFRGGNDRAGGRRGTFDRGGRR
ncbi:MAG: polyribonucleotide nucleotidyltransferase [Patescibacteria group bacterium]|nr:polyribonucleotide nucleotidyltransferase [Patescibacteria group bacterium]MBU1953110.1 polyribonucleotide nucleotidyltransferase [Patescibacteria group bacterium]